MHLFRIKKQNISIITYALCLLFFVGSALISLNRYWQYDAQYYDLGIFGTALYKVAHFQAPTIDHFSNAEGKWIFADHFSPAIFLILPIYWLFPFNETLLVIQALGTALSGLVLYFTARKYSLTEFTSFSVVFAYFSYAGLQHALWWDFHEVTLLTLPMTVLCYFFVTERRIAHAFLFFLCLLFKETLFGFGIGWSLFIFFFKRKWRKDAVIFFATSLLWYFFTIKLVIPFFRGENYYYEIPYTFDQGITGFLIYIFYPLQKLYYVFLSSLSFGLSVLIVPELWPVFGLHYLIRFLSDSSLRHDLGLHYNAEIAPMYAFSLIIALHRIRFIRKGALVYASVVMMCSLFLYQFVTKGPFRLAYIPDFYRNTSNFGFLNELLALVPRTAVVMAQSNLAAGLVDKNTSVYILRYDYEKYHPDYILIDIRPGQNLNNWAGIKDPIALQNKLAQDKNYALLKQNDKAYIYKRVTAHP